MQGTFVFPAMGKATCSCGLAILKEVSVVFQELVEGKNFERFRWSLNTLMSVVGHELVTLVMSFYVTQPGLMCILTMILWCRHQPT